jgi:hypothetical protein
MLSYFSYISWTKVFIFICRMVRTRLTARKSMKPYLWRPLPPEIVDPEPSDSSSDSKDEVLEIIEVSSESEDEGFLEFEPEMEVELLVDLVRPGEVDFEDIKVDRPRKKQRGDSYESDTSDASGDFEIADLTEDTEVEEDLYAGEDPYLFITKLERDSDLDK